jgi:hypothetical protein
MNNSLSSHSLEVKYAGVAVEYGTLALLIESLVQQPVLMMPLERSIQHGSITIFQWMIHMTTRANTHSPVAYATLPAAEIKQTVLGSVLTYPLQRAREEATKQQAQQFQRQLQECVIVLLERSPQVSQVIVPARLRLPDEWVWSARCTDERIVCRDGAWILLEH